MFKLFREAYKTAKFKTIIYVIFSFIGSFTFFIPIILTYLLFDRIELYFLKKESLTIIIILLILFYFIPFINDTIINQFKSIIHRSISINYNKKIKKEFYDKIKKIPYEKFEVKEDFDNFYFIRENVVPSIIQQCLWIIDFISAILTFLLMIIYLSTIHYLLIVTAIVLAIPYIFINKRFSLNNYYRNYRQLKEIRQTNYLYYLLTNKDNKKEMIIDNSYKHFTNLWEQNYNSINKAAIKIRKKTTYITAIYDFIYSLIEVSCIFLFFYLNRNVQISSSLFLSIVMTFGTISSSALSLSSNITNYNLIKINIKKYNEFMQLKEEDIANNIPLKEIEFKNVNFKYVSNETNTLHDISFKFKKNCKYAIVGENGAGKSTFVKLISGVLYPSEGSIFINGKEENIPRNNISFAMQNGYKYEETILENITFGDLNSKVDVNRVNMILELLDLKKYIDSLPNGINTNLGELKEKSTYLSGGQWQKIAIARALYKKDSDLIIFDEPTSSMDPLSENRFMDIISNFFNDKIIIFITHHLKITSLVDEVIYIENGTILEHGSHKELMNLKGKYYELYNYEISLMKNK